jgi:hypothetical protein
MDHKTELSRQPTAQLRARRRQLVDQLDQLDLEAVLHGSVTQQQRRCGKEGCKCTRGDLHGPYRYLAVGRATGRARLLYLPAELAETVTHQVSTGQQVQAALEEISAINLELLARRELT